MDSIYEYKDDSDIVVEKLDPTKYKEIFRFESDRTRIILGNDITTSLFPRDKFLDKFKDGMYVAMCNGDYLGYSLYDIEEEGEQKFCLIYAIHVVKEARGRGIGTRLMNCIFESSKCVNINKFVLDVDKNNERAQKFYRNLGFKISSFRMIKMREK